jgi:exopolysaccharide biosynthesis predicted pyruvyltransferase EpsI
MFIISFDGREESELEVTAKRKMLEKLKQKDIYQSVEIHTYSRDEWISLVKKLSEIGINVHKHGEVK